MSVAILILERKDEYMYKILIKYISSLNKIFWQSHTTEQEDGEIVEFSTDDFEILKEEILKLDAKYGHDALRVINDVTYAVRIDVFDDIENIGVTTS